MFIKSLYRSMSSFTLNLCIAFTLDLSIAFIGYIIFLYRSMRHLQQSTRTDGKAALSLQKLALFRHFYTMVGLKCSPRFLVT